jgi:hypothetical protein
VKPELLLAGVRQANYHVGGIRCLRLFRIGSQYFSELAAECIALASNEEPSRVNDPGHVTNWTRPRGEVLQFSLLNRSGRYDDFSADHDWSGSGKLFHGGQAYSALARFIAAFPQAVNFRINVLGAGASLAAHEEHSIVRTPAGSIGARVRFHLPIVTSVAAELVLDGAVYYLEPSIIYFINHGCVHSARNRGKQGRLHLVWDMPLTRGTYNLMFGGYRHSIPSVRLIESEQSLTPLRMERTGAFMRLPSSIMPEEAELLDWWDEPSA